MAGGFVLGEVLSLLTVEVKIMVFVLIIIILLFAVRQNRGRELMLLLLFCLLGSLRFMEEGQLQPPEWEDRNCLIEAKINDLADKYNYVELKAELISVAGYQRDLSSYGIIILLEKGMFDDWAARQPIKIGMTVKVSGELKLIAGTRNPGEFDFKEYYRTENIYYQMYGKNPEITNSSYYFYQHHLYLLRKKLNQMLAEISDQKDRGVFASILLGDKRSLDQEVKTTYQKNGIAHILAISGLHVSILGTGVYQLLRKLGLGFLGAGLIASFLMVSFAMLTGGSPSVIRAVMMFLCATYAKYLGRTYDLLSALSVAMIFLLWQYPYFLFQAGFQLSFGAVIAIGGLAPWLIELLEITKNWQKTLFISASLQIITCPITIYHFYQFPVYSSVLNLIVVPLMGYLMISGVAGILLSFLNKQAGLAALGAGHYILRIYEKLCDLFDRLPYSNIVVGRPQVWQIILYYFIFALFFLLVYYRRIRKGRQSGLIFLTIVSIVFLWQIPVSGLIITFLDVGQGDGIIVQTGSSTILIDGGSTSVKGLGQKRLDPFLKNKGITSLDYAIVSHGDEDHISGLRYLLTEGEQIHIKNLVLPFAGKDDPVYQPLAAQVKQSGGAVRWLKSGDQIRMGKLMIQCLYPGDNDLIKDRNDHSSVLFVSYGAFHMLLTGDMSGQAEQNILQEGSKAALLKQVDVLKVAHHGSKFSTEAAWVQLLSPKWAVISYGDRNSYGHPHQSTVENLVNHQVAIWETAKNGAIICTTDGKTIRWQTWLD